MTITIKQFAKESSFNTKKQFNNNVNMFLAVHKKDLTPSEYIAFRRLTKLACNVTERVFGITFARINYIVEQICNFDLTETGISRSTVKRMLAKIKKLGLIEVREREGENGRQTSNLYIFKKFGQAVSKVVSKSKTIEPPQTEGEQEEPAPVKEEVFEQLNHLNTSTISSNTNIQKQERDNIISNPTIDKIIKFVSNRINDVIKQGKDITYLSSYVDKTVRSLERQAIVKENLRQIKLRKEQEEKARKGLQKALGMIGTERQPVQFYDWTKS